MKKAVVGIVVVLAVLLSACGSSSIVGAWVAESDYDYGSSTDTLKINSNNTFTYVREDDFGDGNVITDSISGTWASTETGSGEIVTLTFSNGNTATLKLSGNHLEAANGTFVRK